MKPPPKITKIQQAYRDLFNSPNGKIVLKDLIRNHYDVQIYPEMTDQQIWFFAGQRDVVQKITDMMES